MISTQQSKERLEYWLAQMKEAIEQNEQGTDYSPFFEQILSEGSNIWVAKELARLIISEYSRKDGYNLTIGTVPIRLTDYTITELTVRKLS